MYIKVGLLAGEPELQGASTTKRLDLEGDWRPRGSALSESCLIFVVVCVCDEMASAGTTPTPPPKTSDRTTATPGKGTIRNRARRYVIQASFPTTRGKTGFAGVPSSVDHSGDTTSVLLLWLCGQRFRPDSSCIGLRQVMTRYDRHGGDFGAG